MASCFDFTGFLHFRCLLFFILGGFRVLGVFDFLFDGDSTLLVSSLFDLRGLLRFRCLHLFDYRGLLRFRCLRFLFRGRLHFRCLHFLL